MNSKYFSLVTTFFLSVSTLVFGQDSTFNTYQLKLNTEVSVSVPGEVYYSDENGVEVILNDDFELWIDVFKGESYEYFPDLKLYINEMIEGFGYSDGGVFIKKEIRSGLTCQYSITYDKNEDCNIIYGVIQDSFSRKLYEIELMCHNISSKIATSIINGIQID